MNFLMIVLNLDIGKCRERFMENKLIDKMLKDLSTFSTERN